MSLRQRSCATLGVNDENSWQHSVPNDEYNDDESRRDPDGGDGEHGVDGVRGNVSEEGERYEQNTN